MAMRIVTEADILQAAASGTRSLEVPAGQCIVTAQARDKALELGLTLIDGGAGAEPQAAPPAPACGQGAGSPPAGKPCPEVEGPAADALVHQVMDSLRGRLPAGTSEAELERLVRQVAQARLAASCPSGPIPAQDPAVSSGDGVRLIDCRRLLGAGAASVPAAGSALLAEALGAPGESKLAAGYLAWERASFTRVVEAPEVGVVIEGELHLTVGGQTLVGRPGDMIYLPQGTRVAMSAPARVTLACVNSLL